MADQDPPKDAPGGSDDTWKTYSPPVSQPVPETPSTPTEQPLPPTHVPYGTKQSSSYSGTYPPAPGTSINTVTSSDLVGTTAKAGCGVVGLVLAAVVFIPVIIGVIIAVRALSGGWDELQDGMGDPFSSVGKPDMHSVEGFDELVSALKEETGGSTAVFDAVIYPEYAVLSVPADTTSKRQYSYFYDGDLRRTNQGTTIKESRFDLSTIDPAVLVKLFERAKTELVEDPDPTRIYAIISAPTEFNKGAWISVYATNDFSETGYFTADKTGKIISKIATP